MEGGRYFRTGAYEFYRKLSLSTVTTILDKCEKNVMRF